MLTSQRLSYQWGNPNHKQLVRILFMVVNAPMGGLIKVLLEYLAALRDNPSVSCTFLCLTPIRQKWVLDFLTANKVDYMDALIPGKVDKSIFFLIRPWLKLLNHFKKKALRKKAPAILSQFDVLVDFDNMTAYPRLRYTDKPIIGWMHNGMPGFQMNTAKKTHLSVYKRIVCLSDSFLRDCSAAYPSLAGALRHLYNPINIENVRRAAAEASCYVGEGKYFVAVQRLAEDKAVHTIIDAFSTFCRSHADYKLYIVGDGDMRESLQSLAKDCSQIVFTGQLTNPYPLVKNAKALILSSTHQYGEGLGQTLIEAQALGVPCIAADVESGPAELLLHGDAGYLFETENADSLHEAMCNLIKNSEATAAKIRAATAALDRFSPGVIARQFLNMVSDCVL